MICNISSPEDSPPGTFFAPNGLHPPSRSASGQTDAAHIGSKSRMIEYEICRMIEYEILLAISKWM